MQLGTNHLGHFALTNLSLPHITDRVVTLSSTAHKTPGSPRIHFDNLDLTGEYAPMAAYCQSKLTNLLFTLGPQRRLVAAGSPVRALAAPRLVGTNLQGNDASSLRGVFLRLGNRLIAQDSRAYCCTPCTPPSRTCPARASSAPTAGSKGAARRPWPLARRRPVTRPPPDACGPSPRG